MIPHPRCRGDWFLKPSWGAPSGLWYRERQFAVSYAEWVARGVDRAEIRVYNQDGNHQKPAQSCPKPKKDSYPAAISATLGEGEGEAVA